ncbi:MAG: glutathione S-transferase family protein, partial [Ketobacteraceae bacterium]|nr:glutathione S-transferase family protein [Ketobacteraceae bacterium]
MSNKSRVKLYGYATSPFVIKVGVFLKYKQIPFEFVPVNPVFPSQQLKKFPGQRKVPVLTIDEEWRADSTPLGIWLDEVFPDRPILGVTPEDTQHILEMDQWVNDQLIMGQFRRATEWESFRDALHNGWTLSRIIHDSTPIPFIVRKSWPFIVKRVGFVRRYAKRVGLSEPLADMRQRQLKEFLQQLGSGPFLGARKRVSLADLSAWSSIVMPHLIGIRAESPFLNDPEVLAWCHRV